MKLYRRSFISSLGTPGMLVPDDDGCAGSTGSFLESSVGESAPLLSLSVLTDMKPEPMEVVDAS